MRYMFLSTALFSTLLLGGCNPFKSSPKVVLPDTQPIEASRLASTARVCKKEIEDLESRSAYVPKERQKEFDTVVSMASDTCNELAETFERMKSATHQEQTYHQNVQHAKATMLEGRVVSDDDSRSAPKDDFSSDTGDFDRPAVDTSPRASSSISDEPLN